MDPYFFLSYARRHGPRVLVKRFYDDICAELRRIRHELNGQPLGAPFLDVHSIQVGQDWNAALSQALGHCRAMVALYTADYFSSDFCGREWKAFEDRLKRHREATGADAKALIPVLWEPVHVPAGAAHIQYENLAFGESYARVGLRRMLVSDPGGEYRDIVRLIARQIAMAAEHFRIPAAPDLDLSAMRAVGPFPSSAERVEPGSRVVLLVAARTAASAGGYRTDPRCHGTSPLDWNPFYEDSCDPLVRRTEEILAERGYSVVVETVSESLGERLREARRRRHVVLLLVEAHAVADKPYAEALTTYDSGNHPGSAAIVPCGPGDLVDDDESARRIRSAFPLSWARSAGEPLPLLQTGVSHGDFNATVHAIIAKSQNQLFSLAYKSGPGVSPLPTLTAVQRTPTPSETSSSPSPLSTFEEQE